MTEQRLPDLADLLEQSACNKGLQVLPDAPPAERVDVILNDHDPSDLLTIAAEAGARIACIEHTHVDDTDISHWTAELPAHLPVVDELKRWHGALAVVTVAVRVDGAWFGTSVSDQRWVDLIGRLDAQVEQTAAAQAEEAAGNVYEWAQIVAEDATYRRAGVQRRTAAARTILPGIALPYLDDIVLRADQYLDDDLAPKARAMRADGTAKKTIVAALGVPESAVERYLATSGPAGD